MPNRKKISNEHFNLCDAGISLDEIIKSIISETNNKPSGNYSLTATLYWHVSNELAPVLLGVYDFWGKLATMGVTYRTGIISAIRAVSRTNYFQKTGGRPNWEVPNKDMQNYYKIGKYPVTLYKTKLKQMTPVGNAYISYTQTSLKKKIFVTKIAFFLLICLHLHLIDYIRIQAFVGKIISSVSFTYLWTYF